MPPLEIRVVSEIDVEIQTVGLVPFALELQRAALLLKSGFQPSS